MTELLYFSQSMIVYYEKTYVLFKSIFFNVDNKFVVPLQSLLIVTEFYMSIIQQNGTFYLDQQLIIL